MNQNIVQARNKFLATDPLGEATHSLIATDDNGMPQFGAKIPQPERLESLALKFALEFVAHVRGTEDAGDWLNALQKTAGHEFTVLLMSLTFCELAEMFDYLLAVDNVEGLQMLAAEAWASGI